MSRLVITVILAAGFLGVVSAAAADEDSKPSIAAGKVVFERVCAPCHGKGPGTDGARMLPGSAALAARYQGKLSPYLEDRSDLTADALKAFVRRGIGAMPMFRKTEISDSQIEAVAAYLRAASAQSSAGISRATTRPISVRVPSRRSKSRTHSSNTR